MVPAAKIGVSHRPGVLCCYFRVGWYSCPHWHGPNRPVVGLNRCRTMYHHTSAHSYLTGTGGLILHHCHCLRLHRNDIKKLLPPPPPWTLPRQCWLRCCRGYRLRPNLFTLFKLRTLGRTTPSTLSLASSFLCAYPLL